MLSSPKALKNPIPDQIRDVAELNKSFYKEFGIIPYFGTVEEASHGWLQIIKNAAFLSPTHNICKSNISKYSFGGLEADPKFFEVLKSIGLDKRRVLTLSQQGYYEKSDAGNIYWRVRLARVNNEWRINVTNLDSRNVAYLETKLNEAPQLIYTEKFSKEYWKKKLPDLIAATKFDGELLVSQSGEVYETIIHYKNPSGVFYGRPDTIHILDHLMTDYLVGNSNAKATATEMIAKYIFLIQADAPETLAEGIEPEKAIKKYARGAREIMTNEGDEAKTATFWEYDEGINKPEVMKLNVNRDFKFNESALMIASKKIYGTNDWSPILSGEDSVPGSLGSNVLTDLFITKNVSCIMPEQSLSIEIWQKVFEWTSLVTNDKKFLDLPFEFTDTVSNLIEKLRNVNATQQA